MLEFIKMDKKSWKRVDYPILLCTIAIVLIGIACIYSIIGRDNAQKQLVWLCLSLFVIFFVMNIDYKIICNYADIFYWITVAMLLYTRFFGRVVKGARGWIFIGGFSIQPAELAKVAIIIMLAKKLEEMESNVNNVKNFSILAMYCFIPMLLIVLQPDMGMTLVCFFIVLGIFYSAGLNKKVIYVGLVSMVLLVAVVWFSNLMQPHWKARLISFLNPEKYMQDSGYQVMQALIAIGSGELFGSGFMKGTQVAYVPEAHTDCIIAAYGEQWGFLGIVMLMFLYGLVIYRAIKIASNSRDIMGSVITIGVVSYLLFSLIQNIGMNISLMPVTGITLPFFSYGGSSLLTNFISLGLVLNVGMHNERFSI